MKLFNRKNSMYLVYGVGLLVLLYCLRNIREGLDDSTKNSKQLGALREAQQINKKNIMNKINAMTSAAEVSSSIGDLTKAFGDQDTINKAIEFGLAAAKHSEKDS